MVAALNPLQQAVIPLLCEGLTPLALEHLFSTQAAQGSRSTQPDDFLFCTSHTVLFCKLNHCLDTS